MLQSLPFVLEERNPATTTTKAKGLNQNTDHAAYKISSSIVLNVLLFLVYFHFDAVKNYTV